MTFIQRLFPVTTGLFSRVSKGAFLAEIEEAFDESVNAYSRVESHRDETIAAIAVLRDEHARLRNEILEREFKITEIEVSIEAHEAALKILKKPVIHQRADGGLNLTTMRHRSINA